MTLKVQGDPEELERFAGENTGKLQGILEQAKGAGLIAHRFYGSDGQIMVIDEWPDPESFQRFFEGARSEIEPMMSQVARSEPEITFWHKLESHDEYGWGA